MLDHFHHLILLMLDRYCYERAHDLHVWVACPCCWTVPRFPEAACFRKSCGQSLARVCSSLIFSGFRNSAVCVCLTVRGERLAFCVACSLLVFGKFAELSNSRKFRPGPVLRGLSVVFVSREEIAEERRNDREL